MLDLYAKPGYKMNLKNRIKWWFRRRKYARQRVRWGFSEYDVWDFDVYFADLMKDIFAFLAKRHMSHPYDVSHTEWQQTLIEISECFAQYNRELPSPAYEAWCSKTERKKIPGGIELTVPDDVLYEAWRDEEREHQQYKLNSIKRGLELINKWYPNLWD